MTLESPLLSAIPGLRHAFFTRDGGVSDGVYASLNGGIGSDDDPIRVAENRRRMAEQMGVTPDRFLSVSQTHSPDVMVARGQVRGPACGQWPTPSSPAPKQLRHRRQRAADCGPILLADPGARVIGAAGAGWRGARTGIPGIHHRCDGKTRAPSAPASSPPSVRRSASTPMKSAPNSSNVSSRPMLRERAVLYFLDTRGPRECSTLAGFIRSRPENACVLMIDDIGVDTYLRRAVFQLSPLGAQEGAGLWPPA